MPIFLQAGKVKIVDLGAYPLENAGPTLLKYAVILLNEVQHLLVLFRHPDAAHRHSVRLGRMEEAPVGFLIVVRTAFHESESQLPESFRPVYPDEAVDGQFGQVLRGVPTELS